MHQKMALKRANDHYQKRLYFRDSNFLSRIYNVRAITFEFGGTKEPRFFLISRKPSRTRSTSVSHLNTCTSSSRLSLRTGAFHWFNALFLLSLQLPRRESEVRYVFSLLEEDLLIYFYSMLLQQLFSSVSMSLIWTVTCQLNYQAINVTIIGLTP